MAGQRGEQRILVIKHGALGDFVLATGPFAAIRRHHAGAHITLLTTAPYAELAGQSGYFDEVWSDRKRGVLRAGAWLTLRRRLRNGRFTRVYDLQTSRRSSAYFRLFTGRARPEWSGIAPGCSHPHANPARDSLHTIERQAEQLAVAGVADVPPPDLTWLDGDIAPFGLDGRFALLVPGAAPHRPEKRWPASSFAALAARLSADGIRPVLLGAAAERDVLADIAGTCSAALNLYGRTGFGEIAALARRAAGAVGNDTGPMHLIAAAGCPVLVLYSSASDPALTAPRGETVAILRQACLAELPVEQVAAALTVR